MNFQYLKISVVAIGAAVLTYIFFPIGAQSSKPLTHSTTAASGTKQAAADQAAKAKQDRHNLQVKKSTRQSAAQAKIEPDTTLRKERIRHKRSGPPSKMYGGL